ncbi:transporter substrate-binding domain-containing protein [Pseudomonas sp. EA_105y_Pfl2_R69]|uniref:transporter substrate-binding domain-containing protein n=1 Tax=Pseudomonas sp. EA_105y_Pfl2_R69 TaxID=3088683 RepID=UPI0030DC7407
MRIVLPLILYLLAFGLQAQPLRIAMEGQFPPFEEVDAAGQLRGFNVDIAQALCQAMAADCQLVRFAWDDLIPALEEQRADLILASMSITAQRAERVDFTAKYAQTPAFFFARKGLVNEVIVTPRRIAGKRLGVQRDTTYDRFLTDKYQRHTEVLRFDSAEVMYQALGEGRVELVLDDAVSGYFGFLDTDQGQGFEQVGNKVVAPKHFGKGQGIAVRKGDQVLRERLDRALSVILSNGVYKRIEKQYFKQFSVY